MGETLVSRLQLAGAFHAEYLEYNGVFPLELAAGKLRLAVAGEPAVEVLDDLEWSFQAPVEIVPVTHDELRDGVRRAFSAAESSLELVRDLRADEEQGPTNGEAPLADARDLANQPPVIRLVNLLIREAHQARASDLHLEATRNGLRTRYRVDGALVDVTGPPRALQAAVVSRIKLLAELDIAEQRAPQDGRIRVRLEERDLDLRVSTVPTLYGESVVLRLLDHGGKPVALAELGMAPDILRTFRALAARPHGIVLATGPTGSGKTTTLHAALTQRDTVGEKIVTLEDPVEYRLDGVTQVPIHSLSGMTFASALRSTLRQDPDVLMVGEMRDAETAAIAVQSAMTGHIVFATLHTNDAAAAVTRIADLGVEPFLIADALEGVLAQRLVRRICSACRTTFTPALEVLAQIGPGSPDDVTLHRGAGCDACRGTGYSGRTGIFELLPVHEAIREAITARQSAGQLRELARRHGMRSLRDDGWSKVLAGITTYEEVLRVTAG